MEDEAIKNKFFHRKSKGCKIIKEKILTKDKTHWNIIYFCETHQCDVCRCGWEIGFHFGENSLLLDK